MMSSISVTSCFPPFYGINPLSLFLEIFIILVHDLFLKRVALADMIVVLDNSYFHIFSWYACSLQCGTNIGIINHVTTRVLDLYTLYYIHNEIHKQPPKNNRQAQILQHINWRIAVGSQCAFALVRVLTLVQREARVSSLKRDREKEAETEKKVVTG